MDAMPLLMGQAAGAIDDVQPAKQIMSEMVNGAIEILRGVNTTVTKVSSLRGHAAYVRGSMQRAETCFDATPECSRYDLRVDRVLADGVRGGDRKDVGGNEHGVYRDVDVGRPLRADGAYAIAVPPQ